MTFIRPLIAALAGAAISCSPEVPDEESGTTNPASGLSDHLVEIRTTAGDLVVELYPEMAPVTVANFLAYVDQSHYNGTIFHRVIDGYLIEAGKLAIIDGEPVEKPTRGPITSESRNGLTNGRGTIAMARSSDPDSARAAFFINLGDNLGLDYPQPDGYGYTVFGEVISGNEVLNRIGKLPTTTRELNMLHPTSGETEARDVVDVPVDPPVINSVKRADRPPR